MKETFHLQETLDESTISMDMMPEDEEMEDNDNKEESRESDAAKEEEESGGDDDEECGYGPYDHTGPSVGDCQGNCGGYICDHCFNIHDCTECDNRDFLCDFCHKDKHCSECEKPFCDYCIAEGNHVCFPYRLRPCRNIDYTAERRTYM